MSVLAIVPAHNEECTLASTVQKLFDVRTKYDLRKILLVENGSSDGTKAVGEALAREQPGFVTAISIASAGIGYAYHAGILAAAKFADPDDYLLLTAADLPFGFSDLERFHQTDKTAPVYIGSKAHKESTYETSIQRKFMSRAYRGLRQVVVGSHVGDSQGTFFVRMSVASRYSSMVRARDFFYTTELAIRLERDGLDIRELPVDSGEIHRASSVRPFKHGLAMARQLILLRRQLSEE